MVQKRHVHLDHNGDADGSGGGVRGRGGVGCSNGDYCKDEMAMMDGGAGLLQGDLHLACQRRRSLKYVVGVADE